MTNQSTMDKLIEMRLTTMADAFRNQLNDPKFKEVPFEDQFGMLVDIEYSSRKNNRLKRLIKNAGFDQPEANIMDINYTSGRKLNKELIRRLATCEYISEHRNLFITGATGCGKTYMACAFGMEACKQYLQRFFAPSMSSRNGTTNWVVMIVLWQMQSLTALLMTVIVSTLQALMPNMISRCERFMAWTKHYVNKLA